MNDLGSQVRPRTGSGAKENLKIFIYLYSSFTYKMGNNFLRAVYCNRSCLWVCVFATVGGRCPNLIYRADARAGFASLWALFHL